MMTSHLFVVTIAVVSISIFAVLTTTPTSTCQYFHASAFTVHTHKYHNHNLHPFSQSSSLSTTLLLLSSSSSNGAPSPSSSSSSTKKGICVIAGATGYIGKSCVRESVQQGYYTVALVRDMQKVCHTTEGQRLYSDYFHGAHIMECDVSNPTQLSETFQQILKQQEQQHAGGGDEGNDEISPSASSSSSTPLTIDAVVSCLASRSGIKREAFAIDYQATLNCLNVGTQYGAKHFVLLSAICVRKPLLQFQLAKLQFEQALTSQSNMTYSIVRPTAFFKSVSGQLERIQDGKPFLMFDPSTKANPIAESDLATYLIDCISMPSRWNQILNLGGPDQPMTKQEQGKMMFDSIGKTPSYTNIPIWIFDVSINLLQSLANLFQNEQLENAAELGRIGKYYAVEDMVEEKNRYGTISLQEHFDQIAQNGQEYDPYTTMTGILDLLNKDDSDDRNTRTVPPPSIPQSLDNMSLDAGRSAVTQNSTVAEGVF